MGSGVVMGAVRLVWAATLWALAMLALWARSAKLHRASLSEEGWLVGASVRMAVLAPSTIGTSATVDVPNDTSRGLGDMPIGSHAPVRALCVELCGM